MPKEKAKKASEDPYQQALKLREQNLQVQEAKRQDALAARTPRPLHNSKEEGDKRAVGYSISKNRGLTPHKRKELRNPRVKHRLKYEKAVKSRKGQVRQYNAALQDKPYSGEAHGINPYVIKSTPLQ